MLGLAIEIQIFVLVKPDVLLNTLTSEKLFHTLCEHPPVVMAVYPKDLSETPVVFSLHSTLIFYL